MNNVSEILELLSQIISDPVVSKSVKTIAEQVLIVLNDEACAFELKRDKAIQLLGSTDNPNMSSFIRSMIYEVIAKLES